jgi:hypothetical protein
MRNMVRNKGTILFGARADLLVLPVLYTPSKDTFDDVLKSSIDLRLAGSLLRL